MSDEQMDYEEAVRLFYEQEAKTLAHKPELGERYWIDIKIDSKILPDLTPEFTNGLFEMATIPNGCKFEEEKIIRHVHFDDDTMLIRRIYIYVGEIT